MKLVLLLLFLIPAASGWSQSYPAARKPFWDSFSKDHPERTRVYDLQHVLLKLTLDERRRSVSGTSTLVLRPLRAGLDTVELDSAELKIQSVALSDGTSLAFEQSGEMLRIRLPRPANPPEAITVTIQYTGNPRKGLFFVTPDRGYPRKPVQIWSQGEMEDSHFWFPIYDSPNDKATSEGFYTVNADFTVISNGRLVEVTENPALHTKTVHWKQDIPHSTYLISVVAGEFEKYTERVGELPVEYYVPPGTGRTRAMQTFRETPAAIRFFSARMGLAYPYPKYSQVAVHDFTFGGMENISATTLSDRTLHDETSEPQASSVDLITHELSHQWFGDLLTCADWSHIWLNEGFATFWAAVYRENRDGREEYLYLLSQERARYLEEDQQRYRRPLVTSFYTDPADLFDRTTYQKGFLVLDMLRSLLGDERFFAALQSYAKSYQQKTVVTADFEKAVEEATGEKLGWFFDQWIYKAGYPELEVSQQWDESAKRLRLVIEQNQALDSQTPLFRMPVDVEFNIPAGTKTFRIEFSQTRGEFDFPLDSRPLMTRFDPDDRILKTLKFAKPTPELLYQAENDPSVLGRIWASGQLGLAGNDPQVVRALRDRLVRDAFWGVRGAAATALGQVKTPEAREALAEGLHDRDPRVRQAAVRALGSFWKDEKAARLAKALFDSDRNPMTEAEAALAVGKIQGNGARKFLEKAVRRDSDQDVIRRYSLSALGELGDKKGWDIAAHWVRYGRPPQSRIVAIEALSKLGKGEEKTADQLIALLDDPDLFVKQRAITALGDGNFQKARPALLQSASTEIHAYTRRAAQVALARLGASFIPKPTSVTTPVKRSALHTGPPNRPESAAAHAALQSLGAESFVP
ncbi:MAG: hypothetical protein A3J28_01135 [Acidobacteria bacterium RIFCSPLOWO2_12_FULL_60_22]|nr:MAG: hypothetical protein A3J28_01135 [Acidobacteria bacterium RIFCSPLOWO2_12_FULL_60_22]